MFLFDTEDEHCWFVIVTAPLVLGAVPLTLALAPVVGGTRVGQLSAEVALSTVFLVLVGVIVRIGSITARRLHEAVDSASRIGRSFEVDRAVARASALVFCVYLAGMVLAVVSLVFSTPATDRLGSVVGVVLVPFSPLFLLPRLGLSGPGRFVVFTLVGATTGLWHVVLGVVVGRVLDRLAPS